MSKSQVPMIGDYVSGRKNNFDIIRFVAATMVIFSHSYALSGYTEPEAIGTRDTYGHLGVLIFFVISGFLITQSYLRTENFSVFLKSRVLRIFPALIFVVLLTVFVLGPAITTLPIKDYFSDIATYKYISNITLYGINFNLPGVFENNVFAEVVNGSLWTLQYEFTFYLFVGLLGLFGLLNSKRLVFLLFFISLSMLTLGIGKGITVYNMNVQFIIEFFACFSAGMVFYIFRDCIPLDKYIALTCLLLTFISIPFNDLPPELLIVSFSYLIFYFSFNSSINISKFSKFGDFSYGMYVYAFPVQQLVTYLHGGKMGHYENFIISFFVTLLCSIFSWHFIEKKCMKLKHIRLIKKRNEQYNDATQQTGV
ncbi:acyltransferase family protein [Paenibacillus bouchesdurhonensis]|uniref:acyltransferase family protein n=1 Tax=Paenibacillus bouchesdurhonensis TaxID=1870990 RepID=UPI000DA63343|nr:acyltransferase [Paenibacillus bouchesdurhonensis]